MGILVLVNLLETILGILRLETAPLLLLLETVLLLETAPLLLLLETVLLLETAPLFLLLEISLGTLLHLDFLILHLQCWPSFFGLG